MLAALLYWWRIGRRPIDARLKRANTGGFLIVAGAVAFLGLWNGLRPAGVAGFYFWGELAGVGAVYALSCSLVAATRARRLERWFGGLDRMYRWHKRTAITGVALLVPHKLPLNLAPDPQAGPLGLVLGVVSALGLIALVVVSLPRAGRLLRLTYERWLLVHRFTGLLVVIGVLHGLLIDKVIGSSTVLQGTYLLIGAVGVVAYGYEELFLRRAQPTAGYRVTTLSRPDGRTVELRLRPLGPAPTPGRASSSTWPSPARTPPQTTSPRATPQETSPQTASPSTRSPSPGSGRTASYGWPSASSATTPGACSRSCAPARRRW